ncbi:recombinase family protein [Paenibacillus algorifonticola]|uniref:recombinase family protein n=1 Tax=Paenibacillus algorifonticola TaxID=684063 RepID=UPI0015A5B2A2|nr:recombinase family protein [Paenibacillus algorifonticola]
MGAINKNSFKQLRVACLYRVSSKKQLTDDEIPMQRRACSDFIQSKPEWVFVKEYIEGAVSGFRVSASKRDVLQEAKSDAEKGLYDVLLVFMFDRLGRKEDETPFVLKWFVKQGIEMWSVLEGQQKFEDHTDDLTNYIRFWQSSGESKKTSMRVNENHEQMAEDGLFRGGTAGYGYKLVPSGKFNKKGKEVFKREILPEQSEIVDELYGYGENGLGGKRIAKLMNLERNPFIPSPTGGEWTARAINFILSNPLYKGYPAYGKRRSEMGVFTMQKPEDWVESKKQIPELVIIQEERWDRLQLQRGMRAPKKKSTVERGYHINTSKSPLLLVGMVNCGYCGAPLTTTYNQKKYKLANGTMQVWKAPKYRCSGKASGKDCVGQTLYAQSKIETVVLDEIDQYLEQLKQVDFAKEINSFLKKNVSSDMKELKKFQSELIQKQSELEALTAEVTKSIMGQSSFKPDLLNALMDQKNNELNELTLSIAKIEDKLLAKKIETSEMELLRKTIPSWKEVFDSAPLEKKKMLLAAMIDRVIVKKGDIDITVKLHITQFCNSINGSETDTLGRAHRWQR